MATRSTSCSGHDWRAAACLLLPGVRQPSRSRQLGRSAGLRRDPRDRDALVLFARPRARSRTVLAARRAHTRQRSGCTRRVSCASTATGRSAGQISDWCASRSFASSARPRARASAIGSPSATVDADLVVALELRLGARRPHDDAAAAGELEHEDVGRRQAAFAAREVDDLLDREAGDLASAARRGTASSRRGSRRCPRSRAWSARPAR